MATKKACRNAFLTIVAICFGLGLAAPVDTSGIVDYVFDPNPQEITPKMYNWEIRLSAADSRTRTYEIVQATKPLNEGSTARATAPTVLIDAGLIVPNQDGIIDFRLHIGNKQPTSNMPTSGSVGLPIIFSGLGTGKGQSNWIYLPGLRIDQTIPSGKGVQLSGGRLDLIRFIVINATGARFEADIVLRSK
jgi:hypothetical protein